MTDEYDEGPWVDVPEGTKIYLSCTVNAKTITERTRCTEPARYRILTPKPKREFVVGKWYKRDNADWVHCIALENGFAWLAGPTYATRYTAEYIDWSVSPRDEAPE